MLHCYTLAPVAESRARLTATLASFTL
jgi:hypothetical protein